MDEEMAESQPVDIELETPPSPSAAFIPPSIRTKDVVDGTSYAHFSPVPPSLLPKASKPDTDKDKDVDTDPPEGPPCVLGIDEAGRGPVLGPMVYATFYLPTALHTSLLATTHRFDDSKVLTPDTRTSLMRHLCTPATDLHTSCGWAARLLSARDISAHMLAPNPYNLNAQALDATVALIRGVLDRGVNVEHVYIDTVGQPDAYRRKLERFFPGVQITVAKKADSLYPVVSAASVVAKVTRDAALEVCWEAHVDAEGVRKVGAGQGWGSGYPSDARSMNWLKGNMDPVFGWGAETRFSWGPAKELMEGTGPSVKSLWPCDDEEADTMKMTDFYGGRGAGADEHRELVNWYGRPVTEAIF